MERYRESELYDACRLLFGTQMEVNREFLQGIQDDGLRHAYRKRAWQFHPDAAPGAVDQSLRAELFRRSVEAYELLSLYLQQRRVSISKPRMTATKPRPTAQVFRPRPAAFRREKAPGERYYSGEFPSVELKIGLFLYYRGHISYQALVRSLLWQRNQRPPLGELACKWGWMREEAIPVVLKATHIPGFFGERAVKLGLLKEQQLRVLLFHQRSLHQPLGRYFIEKGLLTEDLLRRSLRECAQHNEKVRARRDETGT